MNRLGRAIDHRFSNLRPLRVRARKITHVLGGEVGIEAGDKHRGAHDLGESSRVVLERITRRWRVGCIELERFRARDQRGQRRDCDLLCRGCAGVRRRPVFLASHHGRECGYEQGRRRNVVCPHFPLFITSRLRAKRRRASAGGRCSLPCTRQQAEPRRRCHGVYPVARGWGRLGSPEGAILRASVITSRRAASSSAA